MSQILKRSVQLTLVAAVIFACLGADQDARFQNLGHKLMCVCGCSQVLLECNHVGCTTSTKMRDELAASLDRRESDDLTLQSFVQRYGPTVLIAPTTTGFNRVAWIVPYLALVLGLITLYVVVRAWRNRPAPALADGIRPSTIPDLDRFREQARRDTEL